MLKIVLGDSFAIFPPNSRDNGIFEFLKASESYLEQRIKEGEDYLRPNLIRLQKEHANLVKAMREQND